MQRISQQNAVGNQAFRLEQLYSGAFGMVKAAFDLKADGKKLEPISTGHVECGRHPRNMDKSLSMP
jgi:hypothetical protein